MLFCINVTGKQQDGVVTYMGKNYPNVHLTIRPERIVCHEVCGFSTEFRLAEMDFQLNHNQVGLMCPECKTKGETICGHLTFELRSAKQ